MIYRTVNLNLNHDKWDSRTRKNLLDAWRSHYYENNINMSPLENIPQGGQGYFDSQMYFSSIYDDNIKNISPTDKRHPVNIAFAQRQMELEIEFNSSSQADKERLSNLMEVEKDSHDYWQKNELLLKVLGEDDNGNPYPKELVDEIRVEKNLSEENFRCSMEDLINYDASYGHPLSYPNRDFNNQPITDSEREKWCNRKSIQGIKREYTDENGIDQENKILNQKESLDQNAYRGVYPSYINDERMPKSAKDFYEKYQPSSSHLTSDNQYINEKSLYPNQKENRIEGRKANELEDKIKNHNINTKEPENTIASYRTEYSTTIEQRDSRIQKAQEKVKEVISAPKEFKSMPEMNEDKGYFISWVDKTKEKILYFKEKAINLWEKRVAPKLGIETEKSRKEAHQEVINKINLQEIRNFEKKIKEEEENKRHKRRPKSGNETEINEDNDYTSKKRRPSSGLNNELSDPNIENVNKIKNKPNGESSKQEYRDIKVDEDKFSRKI